MQRILFKLNWWI